MDVFEMWHQAGVMAKFTLLIDFVPLIMAVAYVMRPTERRLALMRPLSLAGLFAALNGGVLGLLNVLRSIAISSEPFGDIYRRAAAGASESLVTTFLGLACLTVAWMLVAVGMSRIPVEP